MTWAERSSASGGVIMPSSVITPGADPHGSDLRERLPGSPGDEDLAIRAVVRAALAAPVPMWVGWGPDLTGVGNAAFEALLARPVRPGSPARARSGATWARGS